MVVWLRQLLNCRYGNFHFSANLRKRYPRSREPKPPGQETAGKAAANFSAPPTSHRSTSNPGSSLRFGRALEDKFFECFVWLDAMVGTTTTSLARRGMLHGRTFCWRVCIRSAFDTGSVEITIQRIEHKGRKFGPPFVEISFRPVSVKPDGII